MMLNDQAQARLRRASRRAALWTASGAVILFGAIIWGIVSVESVSARKEALEAEVSGLTRSVSDLEQKKLTGQVEMMTLEARVVGMKANAESLILEVVELQRRKEELEALVDRMDHVTAEQARRLKGIDPAPERRGQVTAANQQMNIYVIDLGREDGVKVGDIYSVSRGRRAVAVIIIDKVEDDSSTGYTRRGVQQDPIQVGDTVVTPQ